MLSTAPKSKTTLYVATNLTPQQDNNGHQFHINQRKIVKSSSNYNLMAFNKSPTFRQERNAGDESKRDSNLQRSDSFSSVKFFNEGEKLVSQLCDTSLDTTEEKKTTQYNNITVLTRDKSNVKGNVIQLDVNKHDDSVSSQIVQLAVEACTIAENIAIANKNRPCFKNIQTICEKTKSNVQKPDAAVANLHSQGVPWVIKNFIFSFVRILDGWKGVKELLCEKHESFKRIETQYYSPEIRECFFEWQVSTKNMLDNIYKTFSALDSGFQAEQQRYKRYSGINLLALQNKDQKQKQHIKRGSPGPITSPTNQPQFAQFYNQWQNNNVHPISQSMSHGNIFSPWNSQSTSKVAPYQNPNVSIHKNENLEFSKAPTPGNIKILQNKEEIKVTTNIMLQPSMGNITNQPNDDLVIKQQFNTNSLTSENVTHKNTDVKKSSSTSETPPFPSNNWSYNNEVFNPYPNYWINQSNSESKLYNNVQTGLNIKCNASLIPSNPSTYPAVPNISTSSNVDTFSDTPDVTTVYMNPGSYNLPINKGKVHIHPPNADFGTLESLTVHNSTIAKENVAPYSKTIMNTFPPPLTDNHFNILKKNSVDVTSSYLLSNNPSLLSTTASKNIIKGPDEIFTYTDKEWETAIQLAPKFITTIHQSPDEPRTDCQRLYSALETNKTNENIQVTEPTCIESVSWNKISQQFFGGCTQSEFDINYLTNSEPSSINMSIKTDIVKADPQMIFTNPELSSSDIPNDKPESVDSFETCKIENEFGSMENMKKVKKKNNQNYKYLGRKKNDYVASGVKKMENILVTLWNMDRNWPLDKEPKLADVVKNVVTFHIVSDRLKGSYYSDVHQVARDIRMIFYNAYEYLKVHPDEKLKTQVDEMQECFEKMFFEEILMKEQKGKSKKRNDY